MDNLKFAYTSMFLIALIVFTVLFVTSCTYSITMVATHGTASDVVDETASNTPSTSVTPTVTIPAV